MWLGVGLNLMMFIYVNDLRRKEYDDNKDAKNESKKE